MKKILAMLSVAIFATAVFAFAAEETKPELRPAQKLMQARVAWLTAMSENLGAKKFEAVTSLISRRNYNEALPGSWMSKALRISHYASVTSVRK